MNINQITLPDNTTYDINDKRIGMVNLKETTYDEVDSMFKSKKYEFILGVDSYNNEIALASSSGSFNGTHYYTFHSLLKNKNQYRYDIYQGREPVIWIQKTYQITENKTSTLNTTDETAYPTAKCVSDALTGKADSDHSHFVQLWGGSPMAIGDNSFGLAEPCTNYSFLLICPQVTYPPIILSCKPNKPANFVFAAFSGSSIYNVAGTITWSTDGKTMTCARKLNYRQTDWATGAASTGANPTIYAIYGIK